MRAYTSLFGHILGSHPQINGYYEMHLSYESAQDLEQQVQQYALHDPLKPDSQFLFDKLLHNDYDLNIEQLNLQNATILMTIRQPESVLKSIINLFAQKNPDHEYANPNGATQYYIERLAKLYQFSQQYPQSYYYFDAELLRSDTPSLLATLSTWLGLDSPLSREYQRFSQTGVAGAGDTSAAIQSGTVLRQANAYTDIHLDAALLQQAHAAYHRCRAQLIQNALAHAQ
jgi:hypothetical protein